LTDELKSLDLSSKSFDQFVDFFFNRDVVPVKDLFDYFLTDVEGEHYEDAVPSSPVILVKYMTRLFSEFCQIAIKYSLAQVDQAIWGMFSANRQSLHEFLMPQFHCQTVWDAFALCTPSILTSLPCWTWTPIHT
jgi:hypothetical protein